MKKVFNNLGFTLVELIVVVVILTVLSTIGFVSYSTHIASSRDASRLNQLESIYSGLTTYAVNKRLLAPDDSVDIEYNGTVIGHQGYVGELSLESIDYDGLGKDPKDEVFFTYYLTKNRKYFQLMGFLEDEETLTHNNPIIPSAHAAVDYTDRIPTVTGHKLGVLVQEETNTPVQEVSAIKTAGILDIGTTLDTYDAFLTDNSIISGNKDNLAVLNILATTGGDKQPRGDFTSCNDLIGDNPELKGMNGVYKIKRSGVSYDVYCDMTIDNGGWTLLLKADGSKTTFSYSSALWTNSGTLNENNFDYDTTTEFKSPLFATMSFTGVNLVLSTELEDADNSIVISVGAQTSLMDMFTTLDDYTTSLGSSAWKGLISGSSLQSDCDEEGVNLTYGSTSIMIGILGDDDVGCGSPDSWIGIGGEGIGTATVGNEDSSTPNSIESFGLLFVRGAD